MSRISIVGAYQTKFGELWQKSLHDLIIEAGKEAIKDAKISQKQIEIVFIGNKLGGNLASQNHLSSLISQIFHFQIPVVRVEAACASGGMAVSQACLAIESGCYQTALVIGAEKMTDISTEETALSLMTAASQEEQSCGCSFVGLYALMAQAYLTKYKAKKTDLANPAVKNHFHASLNKKAQFPFSITVSEVLASPVVASPLRLLECSPISDGAASIVLSSQKFARKITKKPIYITASKIASDTLSLKKRTNLTSLKATKIACQKAYQEAGIGPKDISLLEVHDCFSIAEILALEDLGIYKEGEGFIGLRNGEVRLGGKRPVNLSGGLKACGHPVGATGVKQIVEIYNQLKGRAGKRQMKNPLVGLAQNVGGTGGTSIIHILQK